MGSDAQISRIPCPVKGDSILDKSMMTAYLHTWHDNSLATNRYISKRRHEVMRARRKHLSTEKQIVCRQMRRNLWLGRGDKSCELAQDLARKRRGNGGCERQRFRFAAHRAAHVTFGPSTVPENIRLASGGAIPVSVDGSCVRRRGDGEEQGRRRAVSISSPACPRPFHLIPHGPNLDAFERFPYQSLSQIVRNRCSPSRYNITSPLC